VDANSQKLMNNLYTLPVNVNVVADTESFDPDLHLVLLDLKSLYPTYVDLRRDVSDRCLNAFKVDMLSVLYDGIYAGNPEDLYNFREGNNTEIEHPVEGLGLKLADINFESLDF
jgi:hypothetical protein